VTKSLLFAWFVTNNGADFRQNSITAPIIKIRYFSSFAADEHTADELTDEHTEDGLAADGYMADEHTENEHVADGLAMDEHATDRRTQMDM
jgi:hypothetical protein